MNPTLDRLRDDVRTLLGTFYAFEDLPDITVDIGLINGLVTLMNAAPPVHATVTIQTAGRSQNLKALLPDLLKILSVTYPWDDETTTPQRAFPYDRIGFTQILFETVSPSAGDKLRVVYLRHLTLAELAGETSNNLPPEYEHALVQLSCAYLLRLTSMRLAANADAATVKTSAPRQMLAEEAIRIETETLRTLHDTYATIDNPSWGSVGL